MARRAGSTCAAVVLVAASLLALAVRHTSPRVEATPAARTIAPIPGASLAKAVREPPGPCGNGQAPPATVGHVIWIWDENQTTGDIVDKASAPYLNDLAKHCGLAMNYHVITHLSGPNYYAATSGLSREATFDAIDHCGAGGGCIQGSGLFGAAGTWKSYQESMPTPCATKSSTLYATDHNPALFFAGLNAVCPSLDVNYSQLATDLKNDQRPACSFITPNLCNDMHDCPIKTGDTWLAAEVQKILSSPVYQRGDLVVFISFDEGGLGPSGEACETTNEPSCLVPTFVVSPTTIPATRSTVAFTHYSLLRTTQELLGLTPLLGQAATALSMRSAFNL